MFLGNQLRPNLHILDYCDAVIKLIRSPSYKIKNKIFNVGHQNMTILNIAKLVKKIISKKIKKKIIIVRTKSNDKRSYHINSDKIYRELNFKPKRTIENAVFEIYKSFKMGNFSKSFENINYFNVIKMIKLKIK